MKIIDAFWNQGCKDKFTNSVQELTKHHLNIIALAQAKNKETGIENYFVYMSTYPIY